MDDVSMRYLGVVQAGPVNRDCFDRSRSGWLMRC